MHDNDFTEWDELDQADQTDELFELVDAKEARLGRKLTEAERDELVANFTRSLRA